MASEALAKVVGLLRSQPRPERVDIQQMRANPRRAFPLAEDVRVERVDAGGVPAEWVSAPNAGDTVILHLHGGGYCLGSAEGHREFGGRIARAASARVLLADYRLAPEHPFPAAVDDAVAVYRYLLGQGVAIERLVLSGDSAGGGLALALLLSIREAGGRMPVGSSRVDLQACKLEYSIVSPK